MEEARNTSCFRIEIPQVLIGTTNDNSLKALGKVLMLGEPLTLAIYTFLRQGKFRYR